MEAKFKLHVFWHTRIEAAVYNSAENSPRGATGTVGTENTGLLCSLFITVQTPKQHKKELNGDLSTKRNQ